MNGYTRISKQRARKMWDKNENFYICPAKLRPGYPWAPEMRVDPEHIKNNDDTFDQMVANFAHYNCSHEAGYYPVFYVK